MSDSIYNITRRLGRTATLVRVLGVTTEAETGERVQSSQTLNIRNVVKTPTQYTRLFSAKACAQDIGLTTFLFWTRDLPAAALKLVAEDYIIMDGIKYQVVTSVVEATGLNVTANEVVGAAAVQVVSVDASNSMGLADDAEVE